MSTVTGSKIKIRHRTRNKIESRGRDQNLERDQGQYRVWYQNLTPDQDRDQNRERNSHRDFDFVIERHTDKGFHLRHKGAGVYAPARPRAADYENTEPVTAGVAPPLRHSTGSLNGFE
ncbi:hypothetical protein EVAR_103424_1 [Eumeta japonica]|uniref:Uncharacterized protein n=1 Tax=Eumeta variegata TaxID=151549 RepID=A0A4C1Z6L2_EUMVA|nr:hypothetical protein EVAR_103424_1 [Eumeta japonica]